MWPQLFPLGLRSCPSFSFPLYHTIKTHFSRAGGLVYCVHCRPQNPDHCLYREGAQSISVDSTNCSLSSQPPTHPDLSAIPSLRISPIACACLDRGHQRPVLKAGLTVWDIPPCTDLAPQRHQSVGDGYSGHCDILRAIQRLLPGPPRQHRGMSVPGTSTRQALKPTQ